MSMDPTLSKRGVSGDRVQMMSNYVVLKNRPDKAIYQYNVSYNPPIESKKLRSSLLRDHQESLIGNIKVFDGMILYLPQKLPNIVTEVVSQTKDGEAIKITIKLTNELKANSPSSLQLFNVLFRRILSKIGMQQIGRNYYNKSLSIVFQQHKLELWPGFVTSILQYERNVMLCADISHKIMRTDTVLDFFYSIRSERNFTERSIKALVGEIVLTRYNNRTYRIDDINWDMNPRSTFINSSGDKISFIDYYAKQYNLKDLDQNQPLLVSLPRKKGDPRSKGPSGPVLLVPQLCIITGLSDEAREDFRVMKDLAVYTRQPPQQRIEGLSHFVNLMNTNPEVQDILGGWNLEFEKSLLKFYGRSLPPENILQNGAVFSYKPAEADWSHDMRGKKIINPIALRDYIIIFTKRDQDSVQDFATTLMRVGPPMGISISEPIPYCLANDRTESYLAAIDSLLKKDTTQMVICILSNNRKDRYDAIKKKCCVETPVPSQCIVGRTLTKKQMMMTVTTKVILQINCKLGGELWAVEIPLRNMMVVGIDTYHDSARKGRSVGGIISSTNASLTSYYSQTLFHHSGQEIADGLETCMKSALEKYHEANGNLPDRIIVYRDGVGDGQLEVVKKYEVDQILGSFKLVSGSYNPKFAVVVVKKRINTRLFTHECGQMINPIPGTVVDTEITKPEWYDFFLVSQSVRQGTVSPTHFNVIHDTSGLKPDHMQRLTYKLTHLYYNWPGTVRVPAPCQYAHKLAFLVGQSIHDTPAKELRNRLYFL